MGLFGAANGCGWGKAHPLEILSHILYKDETWHSYTLSKENPKTYINYSVHQYFFNGIRNFCYIKKYRYSLYFKSKFLVHLTFFESLKVALINMVATFMISGYFRPSYEKEIFK